MRTEIAQGVILCLTVLYATGILRRGGLMMSSTTRFNVRLPAPVMRQIKREAQARHLTMSAVVRAVLCTHYHRKEPR